jgi:hypothetical protein
MAVKTSKAGSIKALRASVERKGGGNDAYLQRIPADDSLNVRFLTEPEDWQSYFEHYDPVMRYYPCSDNCPGCTEGDRPSQKYLANALDIAGDRVVPLVLPKSLVTKLLNSYDKYKSIADRDYELIRLGSGLDTDYDRAPEAPAKRATKGYQLLDLAAVLDGQLRRAFDQDEDVLPDIKPSAARPGGGAKSTRAVPIDVEDDDEDDADEVTTVADREELEDMSLRELRVYAKSEMKIDAADIRGLDQDALIELIMSRSAPAEEVKDADDDDADDEGVDQEDSAPEEDDGEEELTEEDIRAMTLQELRKLCGQLEISWKRTDGKALLIKKVLESIDDDEDDDVPPF